MTNRRKTTLLLVALALILAMAAFPQFIHGQATTEPGNATPGPYMPLTDAQVESYLASITWEQLKAEIIKLDLIEHGLPVVTPARPALALTTDRILALTWLGPLAVDVPGGLHYAITLPPVSFPGLLPPERHWALQGALTLLAATGLSLVIDLVGSTQPGWTHWPAQAVGLGAGLALYYLPGWEW